jgi:2'-5' RNA ligase
MERVFVAIAPPLSVRQALVDLDPHIDGVHWTQPDQMHLTLGFFGHVSEHIELPLREKLGAIQFGAFFLPITGIGAFPPKGSPKIVWIGVGTGHPHLFQLHKRVQDAALAIGLEPNLRPWHPHVTLARCRDVTGGALGKFLKLNAEFHAGMFRVDAFHLFCSKLTPAGPIHTCALTIEARDGSPSRPTIE